jgi:hypothetical protein
VGEGSGEVDAGLLPVDAGLDGALEDALDDGFDDGFDPTEVAVPLS